MKFPRVVKDLLAAREVLVRHGWQQDDYGAGRGPRCTLGAIRTARRDPYGDRDGDICEAAQMLRAVLAVDNVAIWNDEEGRTKDQVMSALDAAASLALSESQR